MGEATNAADYSQEEIKIDAFFHLWILTVWTLQCHLALDHASALGPTKASVAICMHLRWPRFKEDI